MKVEEPSNSTPALAGIPSAERLEEATAAALLAAPNVKWTPQDAICAKLFGPWNNLPCYDHINEVHLLRELDSTIVLFEARIHHSDIGFRAWRERHQRAMDTGLADVPGFPCLQAIHDGKRVWRDDVWEQRYHYLVTQRHRIAQGRLSRLFGLPRDAQDDFFGDCRAPPRATMKKRGRGAHSRPLGLRCDWWKPLDFLLERAAERWQKSVAEIKARFWMDERRSATAASIKTQTWEEALRGDELSMGSGLGKENIEPFDAAAAALPAGLVQGPVPGLSMHGGLAVSF